MSDDSEAHAWVLLPEQLCILPLRRFRPASRGEVALATALAAAAAGALAWTAAGEHQGKRGDDDREP